MKSSTLSLKRTYIFLSAKDHVKKPKENQHYNCKKIIFALNVQMAMVNSTTCYTELTKEL